MPEFISFLRGGDPVFGNIMNTSSQAVLTIPSFSNSMHAGDYECRTRVGTETGVSQLVSVAEGK